MNKIQLRGNCPCCGAQQAVMKSGRMSKHGYTVQHGWFQGVCSGDHHKPMQQERSVTEGIIKSVRDSIAELKIKIQNLKDGVEFPDTVRTNSWTYVNGKREYEFIPYDQATVYQKEEELNRSVNRIEIRISSGISFCNDMEKLLNQVHGTPLIEVEKVEAAKRIEAGEKRIAAGGRVMTAKYQDGGRVYYTVQNTAGVTFDSWMGSRAWRNLELATN